MKKLAVIAAAAMLVFGFVGQAAAFFDDLSLIRSIYDTASPTIEVGSDLGPDVSTFSLTNPIHLYRGDQLDWDNLFVGGLADLRIGYFAHDVANKDFYMTGYIDGGSLWMGASKQANADTAFNNVQRYYDDDGFLGQTTVVADKTNVLSYWFTMEKNGVAIGSGAQNLNTLADYQMTETLADLLSVGYVDQLLYYFDYNSSRNFVEGEAVAVIRTFLTSDGQTIDLAGDKIATVINPSAVPIPGSVLLLASGLLGIFGFRRKRA